MNPAYLLEETGAFQDIVGYIQLEMKEEMIEQYKFEMENEVCDILDTKLGDYDKDCIFEDLDLAMEPFQEVLLENHMSLLKQLFSSYRSIIMECLSSNYDLRARLDSLKKCHADMVYKSNMRHLQESFYHEKMNDYPTTLVPSKVEDKTYPIHRSTSSYY